MEATMLADVWAAAKVAGQFGAMIMTLLWYLERKERLKLQGEKDNLLERALTAFMTSNNLLDKIQAAIQELARRP
jgi:pyoverdine/dityrosine biosynthesis protein Dit1